MGADLQGFLGGWGKGADAVSWEIDFSVRNSHGGHQQIMTKNRESQRVIKNNVIFCRGNWDFVRFQERPLNYMIPQKTTCLTTAHIGDSEWHGFFCRLQGSPRCPKKLSKTSKNNRGNRKREWEEGQVLVLISGGWWDVLARFLRGWHGEFYSPTYFCHVVWPHSPPPGVLWFLCCEFTIRSNFSIQTLLSRPSRKGLFGWRMVSNE